jgi:voltage-gated potassium channel
MIFPLLLINSLKTSFFDQKIQIKILLFIIISLIFSFIYTKLNENDWNRSDGKKNIDFNDAFYFATVTMGTVGYGDITPLSIRAKRFTQLQIIVGFAIAIM